MSLWGRHAGKGKLVCGMMQSLDGYVVGVPGADLTQEEAADLLCWSRAVLVNFENDRRDFGVADLILFARILAHARGSRRGARLASQAGAWLAQSRGAEVGYVARGYEMQ